MRRARWVILAGSIVSAAMASGWMPDGVGAPLFDSAHAPVVLVEARNLAEPPRIEANRLVRGWVPWMRPQGGEFLLPWPNARLQVVDLELRPRRLVFDGLVLGDRPRPRAVVRVGGERQRVVLEDRFEIELPAASAPGRRAVDIRLKHPGTYALRAVAVEPASTGGLGECDEVACRQTGPSIIEAVRRVLPGTRLSGVFEPPASPGDGQRFELVAFDESGAERTLFSWRPGRWWRRGPCVIDTELVAGSEPGWVRLWLRASGSGTPAVWRNLRLREPPRETPPAPELPAPPRLVLVYVMDAWRADHATHLGGEPDLTPVIDRLAGDGATFRRHLSVAPNTMPSTKSLFAGRRFLIRGGRNLPAPEPPTLAEAFATAGYRTGAFSANGHVSEARGTARGFAYSEESLRLGGRPYGPGPGYNNSAERVHRAALKWLDGLEDTRRVFLYLHTIHPHTPYAPPPDLVAQFTADIDSAIDGKSLTLGRIGQGQYRPTRADKRRLARLYAASVAYNDREIGDLLAALGKRYRPEEVMFVLTSDHGEELFDHGGVLHGYTLYDEQVRVPLVVHWPGTVAPAVVDLPSDTIDVHDGLRALVDPAAAAERPGFWRHLEARALPQPEPAVQFAAAASVPGGIFAARTEHWKLIWAPQVDRAWGMGGGSARTFDWEYLFDLTADDERVNLAGERHFEADWLRSRLAAWIKTGLAEEIGGEEPALDESARAHLRALGYLD